MKTQILSFLLVLFIICGKATILGQNTTYRNILQRQEIPSCVVFANFDKKCQISAYVTFQTFDSLYQYAKNISGTLTDTVIAIIIRESRFNPKARNKSGSRGLGQFMPIACKHHGFVYDSLDNPYYAIDCIVERLNDAKKHGYNGKRLIAAYGRYSGANDTTSTDFQKFDNIIKLLK